MANRLFTISTVANGRNVGSRVERVGEQRAGSGKKNRLLIGDSMCAKNTDTANRETKGYCWYKATNGIKRHLLVDVLGNPYFVHCTQANISDDDGLLAIIKQHQAYFLIYQRNTASPYCWTTAITKIIWSKLWNRSNRCCGRELPSSCRQKSHRCNARRRKRRIL